MDSQVAGVVGLGVLDYMAPTQISSFFDGEKDGWVRIAVCIPVIDPSDVLYCPVYAKVEGRQLVGWTTETPASYGGESWDNPKIQTRISSLQP